MEVYLTNWKYH